MKTDALADGSPFTAMFKLGDPDGLRVAVKDCIDIAAMTTRCGSASLGDAPAARKHAVVVDRILNAGCQIVGKTRMHELAFGMTGINIFEGTPLNPKWPDRIPGGSSSGSAAAVAAELVDFAIGTDTGGSVRQPAICCGVIGFKPTFGRVSRTGASPVESSLDCIGPFAASLDMIEQAMCIIDPKFEREDFHGPLRIARIRIGPETTPEMAQACKALQLGDPDHLDEVELPTLGEAFSAGMTIIASETLAANVHLLGTKVPLGSDIRKRLEAARSLTDEDVARSEDVRLRFTAEVDALLDRYDAIVTPAMPVELPLLSDASNSANVLSLTRFLRPFNLSGHPAIVLPTVTSGGLPSGVQIVGRKGEDARLCAIARRLSKANSIFQIKE